MLLNVQARKECPDLVNSSSLSYGTLSQGEVTDEFSVSYGGKKTETYSEGRSAQHRVVLRGAERVLRTLRIPEGRPEQVPQPITKMQESVSI